jgi:TonB-linked SusC/RagA family outer membrane protein
MKTYLLRSHLLLAKFLLAGIFLCFQLSASAQQRTISGTVTGPGNVPSTGVTVLVKGTSIGTLTDLNGKFTLSIPVSAKILSFTFVGMVPQELEIGSRSVFDVSLTESAVLIDEVVVVGYGTQKKISVTGAVTSVGGDQIVKAPTASITNNLAGRLPGLTTVQYSGQPGNDEPNFMFVRGIGTLSSSNSVPLMLVDGVERPFGQMDPNEVQSISILKDASATAVYGIRGANGVIIVTTKRGTEGKPQISFTSSVGVQIPKQYMHSTDSYTYAIDHNKAQLNDDPNDTPQFSPFVINAFKTNRYPLVFSNVDWYDVWVKKAALQTQHNLNMSGGTKLLKYFFSVGYLNQDGLGKTYDSPHSYNYGYQRFNYRGNIDLDLTSTTRFSLSAGYRSQQQQTPGGSASDFMTVTQDDPFHGQIYQGKAIVTDKTYIPISSGFYAITAMGYNSGYKRIIANIMNLDLGVTQKLDFITKGLTWRLKVSNNNTFTTTKQQSYQGPTYAPIFKCDVEPTAVGDSSVVFRKSGSDGILNYSESVSKSRNWYAETALNYERRFGPHNITGLILYNESQIFYPAIFTDIPSSYVGLAARGTYDYKSKYLLELNIGYNGSENFAPGKRFGFFPAVSAGWVITEEKFLKDNLPFIEYMKLRASYGVVGNDRLGNNRFLYLPDSYNSNSGPGYSFGINIPQDALMASEGNIGNPNVTWEKSRKQDYGTDLTFLGGKLGLTADYFYEYRDNILATRNGVPSFLTISLPAENIGKVQNSGYEVEIRWKSKAGAFNYNIAANISYAHNKIIFMDEVLTPWDYHNQTGKSIDAVFGYVFDGFWTADQITHLSDYPNANYDPKPGDARWKDMNKDGVIDGQDRSVIGYPNYPEYVGSLSGGIDYKGFSFNMQWTGAANVSRNIWTAVDAFQSTQDGSESVYVHEQSWTPETAATATLPRLSFAGKANNITPTSIFMIKDASYIRLKSVEISYGFGDAALKRLGISQMRVSLSAYDVLTFSKWKKYFDPEMESDFNNVIRYPNIEVWNIGLNVTF